MTMLRRIFALVLTLCLMLPLSIAASADGVVAAAAFKQGAYASEGSAAVYFTVANAGTTGLYSVPSVGGTISLLDVQQDIQDVVAVGDSAYYLRSVSGAWQLVRLTGSELTVLHMFAAGAAVSGLGYYDGRLYAVSNNWLYAFDAATGAEQQVSEQEMTEYFIIGGRIYYVSNITQRTYTRTTSDGDNLTATAGCLYSMAMDGTDAQVELEIGISDLRGYGEAIYFHNYADGYPVQSSTGEKWMDGYLYRYNIITETVEQASEGYDWDFYPTANGLLIYTLQSIDMRNVTENTSVNLLQPEQYTSVTVDGSFALVYQHTAQSMTRVPTNGEIPVKLGEILPSVMTADLTDATTPAAEDDAQGEQITQPQATKKPTTTRKPSNTASSSDYIFPESNVRKLTVADLKKVDPTLWAYGRNEIWARHGYEFNKDIYATYFAKKSWYTPGGYDKSDVSSIEWYNMEFIQKYEDMYKDEIAALKNGTATTPSGSSKPTDSSYIFPNSSTTLLTREDVLSIDRSLWGFARNEIYARHGYEFNNSTYAKYFANKTWYRPGGFSTKDLNDIEWANMDLIKKMEREY